MRFKFNTKTFVLLLLFLILLNFIDGIASAYWVSHGFALEANPLMRSWMDIGYKSFLYIKLSIVIGCSILLWMARQRPLAHILILPVLGVYLYILYKHIVIAFLVFYSP